MVLLISQHLLTYSPHCTHSIHVTEQQHHLLAVGVCGNLEHESKRAMGEAEPLLKAGDANKAPPGRQECVNCGLWLC